MNINEIELASKLAHNATRDEVLNPLSDLDIMEEDDMWQPLEGDEEELVYKPEVQEIFNNWYDYFYDEIINTELINPI